MTRTPKSPAPNVTPEQALERMKEFTRRLIQVPKADTLKPKRSRRRRTK